MRVTVGAVAVLGLAVTVATAQPGKERAAALKAPEPVAPGELPLARGAGADEAPLLSSTPVPRTARGAAPGGPAWLSGVDPNVLPAGGVAAKGGNVRALGAPPGASKRDDPIPPPPKVLDRLRPFPGDKPPASPPAPPAAAPQPQPQQPTAASPFRGTGSNGAPVYAGPPAYRWYGWGSVTPGANPLAPAGQYPKASANWYAITGATPGAFPVPVTDAGRVAPGTEPPTYGLAASKWAPPPAVPLVPAPQPAPVFVERTAERPEPPKFNPPPESKFLAAPPPTAAPVPPSFAPPSMPVSVPTLAPLPGPANPKPAAPVTAAPALPPMPPVPAPALVGPGPLAPPSAPPAPAVPKVEPIAVTKPAVPAPTAVPVVPPALPVPSVLPAEPAPVAAEPKPGGPAPAPLPTSVTADPPREEPKWQQSSEQPGTRPGTWAPATNAAPLPTVPVEKAPDWHTGRAIAQPVVRAQQPDAAPDPIAALVKQVCKNRAEGVEVRWTGTKKLQVCFEIRTAEAAKQLVADISKRPELTAYQIDFCVLVK